MRWAIVLYDFDDNIRYTHFLNYDGDEEYTASREAEKIANRVWSEDYEDWTLVNEEEFPNFFEKC